jgi:hypothetical protein
VDLERLRVAQKSADQISPITLVILFSEAHPLSQSDHAPLGLRGCCRLVMRMCLELAPWAQFPGTLMGMYPVKTGEARL